MRKPIRKIFLLLLLAVLGWVVFLASRPLPTYDLLKAGIASQFSVEVISAQYEDTPRGDNQIMLKIHPSYDYDEAKDRALADMIAQWMADSPAPDKKQMQTDTTDQVLIDLEGGKRPAETYIYDLRK